MAYKDSRVCFPCSRAVYLDSMLSGNLTFHHVFFRVKNGNINEFTAVVFCYLYFACQTSVFVVFTGEGVSAGVAYDS